MLTRPLGSPREPGLLILGEDKLREEAARDGLCTKDAWRPASAQKTAGHSILTDLDGRPMDLGELAGRQVWIVFWATATPVSRRSPICGGYTTPIAPTDWCGSPSTSANRPRTSAAMSRSGSCHGASPSTPSCRRTDAYGAIGTPTHYFIDRDSRIASRAFGRLDADEMEAHLARILELAD